MKPKSVHIAVVDLVTSVGGTQAVMASVLPGLSESFHISIIDPYNNRDYGRMMAERGLPVINLGWTPQRPFIGGQSNVFSRLARVLQKVPWFLLILWRFRRWVRKTQPDIVYFNQRKTAVLFGMVLPRTGPRLVHHCHGLTSSCAISRHTARFLSRRFARAFAVSQFTSRQLVKGGVDQSIVKTVYNGVDIDVVRDKAKVHSEDLPPRRPNNVVFVQVAVVSSHKGQHVALEAFAQVASSTDSQLWFCGDVMAGGDSGYLDRLRSRSTELGLQNRVCFLGWRKDVPHVLETADVCILPSLSESFGLALVEAMALGKPCIGTNLGGVPEVIEDGVTGLICEPSPEPLARSMMRLAGSRQIRNTMGEAGLKRAERLFDLPRQTQELTKELLSVVNRA